MATWRTIADAEVDPDSPVTSELMTALRDNLDATAEGASGAPSILPNIAANAAIGAVGTYVFALATTEENEGDGIAPGDTVSGSGLIYSGVTATYDGTTTAYSSSYMATGSALSGTWMAMGSAETPAVLTEVYASYNATLFLRIV